ncbi:MAG: T9SS type A sorting domain-containing protein, partial [Bacteroidia bacterium]
NYIDLNGCAGSSEALTVGAGISPVTGFAWDQISNFEVVFEANTSANQTSTWLINDTILVGDSVVYNFPYEYLWNVVQIVDNECGSDTFSLAIEVIKQVGIEDLTQVDFYIYPNPSSNQIAIRQVNGFLKSYTLQVFNSAGQRIESINHLGGDALVIDVRNWSSGVYDFVFNDLKQIKHLRFIR